MTVSSDGSQNTVHVGTAMLVLDVIPLGMWNRISSDEIASRAGVSKSTVLRVLRVMTEEPAEVRSADRWTPAGYRPGYYRTS